MLRPFFDVFAVIMPASCYTLKTVCSNEKVANDDPIYKYKVIERQGVARIGSTCYSTLAGAVDNGDGTFTVVKK